MGVLADAARKLDKDLKHIKTAAPRKAISNVRKEIPPIVSKAMDEWYGSYSPTTYKRTYGLHSGVTSGEKISTTTTSITLDISSDAVPDHRHDSGEYIFNGAFMLGIHGTSQIAVTTPPWEIYEDEIADKCDEELEKAVDFYWNSL